MDIGLENKAYAGGTEISMKILFLWKQHSSVLLYNVLYSLTCCPSSISSRPELQCSRVQMCVIARCKDVGLGVL